MRNVVDCNSIKEVRSNIDRIDRQIVTLLAERGGLCEASSPVQENHGRRKGTSARRAGHCQGHGAIARVGCKLLGYRASVPSNDFGFH